MSETIRRMTTQTTTMGVSDAGNIGYDYGSGGGGGGGGGGGYMEGVGEN